MAKPIGQMSKAEIAEWKRELIRTGQNPGPVDFPKPPSGAVAYYDGDLRMVIEEMPDGFRNLLSLEPDGMLSRTPLFPKEGLHSSTLPRPVGANGGRVGKQK